MPSMRKGESIDEFRARCRAYQATPEGRKRNADKNRKYWATEEGRKRMRASEIKRSQKPSRLEYNLRRELRKRYGITLEQFNQMHTAQNGKCAVCGGINTNGSRLSVDHNHDTKKVRALLCSKCNFAIGLVDESVDRLLSIITYLTKWNQPS